MPFSPFIRETKPRFWHRLDGLSPTSQRQWGSLTPEGMLAHLTFAFEMTTGKQKVADQSTFFSRTVIRWVACDVLKRFPRGRVVVDPAMTPEATGGLAAERARLDAAVEDFFAELEAHPNREIIHPGFGPMTVEYCARVHGIHVDHHLKQFGL